MNERLKELAKQASIMVDTTFGQTTMPEYKAQVDLNKFAELIVRECSKVITDLPNKMVDAELSPYNEGWRNGRLLAKEHIEQYFGVEE